MYQIDGLGWVGLIDRLTLHSIRLLDRSTLHTYTRPPIWRARERAKHDAWARHAQQQTPEAAMAAYVSLVGEEGKARVFEAGGMIPSTEEELQEEAAAAAAAMALDGHQPSTSSTSQSPPPYPRQRQQQPLKRPCPQPSSLTHHAPARPFGDWVEGLSTSSSLSPWALHPRKRLDITYADLAFAAAHALLPASRDNGDGGNWLAEQQQQEEGQPAPLLPPLFAPSCSSAASGGGGGARGWLLPCLSVRTAWDLLLRALALPPGSEVLMTGVTIPDMVKIARRHGLLPVPMDLDPLTLAPSLEDLHAALEGPSSSSSSKGSPRLLSPRLLVLTHLFGARIPPRLLAPLVAMARGKGLLVVEDCAQALFPSWASASSAQASEGQADVSFYSFGTIKTATALGGGVMVLHHPHAAEEKEGEGGEQPPLLRGRPLLDRLRRLQQTSLSSIAPQSTPEVLARVLKAAALHALSTPAACGLLAALLGPAQYDEQLTRWTRGFPAKDEAGLFRLLRRRPHPAVLALLRRRVDGVGSDPSYLLARCLISLSVFLFCFVVYLQMQINTRITLIGRSVDTD